MYGEIGTDLVDKFFLQHAHLLTILYFLWSIVVDIKKGCFTEGPSKTTFSCNAMGGRSIFRLAAPFRRGLEQVAEGSGSRLRDFCFSLLDFLNRLCFAFVLEGFYREANLPILG